MLKTIILLTTTSNCAQGAALRDDRGIPYVRRRRSPSGQKPTTMDMSEVSTAEPIQQQPSTLDEFINFNSTAFQMIFDGMNRGFNARNADNKLLMNVQLTTQFMSVPGENGETDWFSFLDLMNDKLADMSIPVPSEAKSPVTKLDKLRITQYDYIKDFTMTPAPAGYTNTSVDYMLNMNRVIVKATAHFKGGLTNRITMKINRIKLHAVLDYEIASVASDQWSLFNANQPACAVRVLNNITAPVFEVDIDNIKVQADLIWPLNQIAIPEYKMAKKLAETMSKEGQEFFHTTLPRKLQELLLERCNPGEDDPSLSKKDIATKKTVEGALLGSFLKDFFFVGFAPKNENGRWPKHSFKFSIADLFEVVFAQGDWTKYISNIELVALKLVLQNFVDTHHGRSGEAEYVSQLFGLFQNQLPGVMSNVSDRVDLKQLVNNPELSPEKISDLVSQLLDGVGQTPMNTGHGGTNVENGFVADQIKKGIQGIVALTDGSNDGTFQDIADAFGNFGN